MSISCLFLFKEGLPIHRALSRPFLVRGLLLNGCYLGGTKEESLVFKSATGPAASLGTVELLLKFGCRLRDNEKCPEKMRNLYRQYTAVPSLKALGRMAFLKTPSSENKMDLSDKIWDANLLPTSLCEYLCNWEKWEGAEKERSKI
jgi:hypothetical protein